jgi:hypothetical protein
MNQYFSLLLVKDALELIKKFAQEKKVTLKVKKGDGLKFFVRDSNLKVSFSD